MLHFLFTLTDLGVDEDDDEPISLPNVNSAILRKVIKWCTYHKDDPPPPEDDENREKRTDDLCGYDLDFLKVDQGTLFELILVRTITFFFFIKPQATRMSTAQSSLVAVEHCKLVMVDSVQTCSRWA